jgi:hypothetical protein
MWDVAVKVQVASTTERCFGSVGTITEPSLGGDPGDRARECGIETLNVPLSGTLQCDVCICPGECWRFLVRAGRHGMLSVRVDTPELQATPWWTHRQAPHSAGVCGCASALCAAGRQTTEGMHAPSVWRVWCDQPEQDR